MIPKWPKLPRTPLREFVQSMLNRGIHRHVEKYGCYANRDICKLVREAGLHIALEQRLSQHWGVPTFNPFNRCNGRSTRSLKMPRQVSFSVKCADTRVGLHVRVVGSVAALGEWDPHKGLVLNTSASDFPNWKQTEPMPLEEGKVVEYKYVICDNNGSGVRWEERANRALHIADLVEREMVPPNGLIAITENFVAYDCDEMRFRARGGLDRVRSSSSRLQSRQGSQIMHEHSGGYGGQRPSFQGGMINSGSLSDLLAPTIRERKPSKMGLDVMGGYRRDSAILGDIKPDGDAPEIVEPHDPTPHNSSIAGDTGMVREESCSNLFDEIIQPEDTQPDKSEFEDKYALVGNGPLGEGTFGLVWRCTPKSSKVIREDKEMAAKIVRKARLQPRDMKYLLGDDGEVQSAKITGPLSFFLISSALLVVVNHALFLPGKMISDS
eukprot:s1390_g6.t1